MIKMKNESISAVAKDHPVPDEVLERARKSEFPMRVIGEYQFSHYEGRNDDFIKMALDALDEATRKIVVDRYLEKIKYIQETMKVCSFCESPGQLLMWSHYTDFHKGFCIEYDTSRWPT